MPLSEPTYLIPEGQVSRPVLLLGGNVGYPVVVRSDADIHNEGYSPGVSGWTIKANGDVEFNDGTFRGTIEASEIHIPGLPPTAGLHVDSSGNMWWGSALTAADALFTDYEPVITAGGAGVFDSLAVRDGSFTVLDRATDAQITMVSDSYFTISSTDHLGLRFFTQHANENLPGFLGVPVDPAGLSLNLSPPSPAASIPNSRMVMIDSTTTADREIRFTVLGTRDTQLRLLSSNAFNELDGRLQIDNVESGTAEALRLVWSGGSNQQGPHIALWDADERLGYIGYPGSDDLWIKNEATNGTNIYDVANSRIHQFRVNNSEVFRAGQTAIGTTNEYLRFVDTTANDYAIRMGFDGSYLQVFLNSTAYNLRLNGTAPTLVLFNNGSAAPAQTDNSTYFELGELVICQVNIAITANSAASGEIRMSGLPYGINGSNAHLSGLISVGGSLFNVEGVEATTADQIRLHSSLGFATGQLQAGDSFKATLIYQK